MLFTQLHCQIQNEIQICHSKGDTAQGSLEIKHLYGAALAW